MSNGQSSGINQRIADRLLGEGWIKREDHQRAVEHATRHRSRIEDSLIDLDILNEADLLKFIATAYATRFVSTEKLAKAAIDPRLLSRVPVRTADLHGVFPVLFDDKAIALSVVTADPDNDEALHEVKLAASVREVRALVARPAAVRAAIAAHYRGEPQAFASLLRRAALDLFSDDPWERKSAPAQGSQTLPRGSPQDERSSPPEPLMGDAGARTTQAARHPPVHGASSPARAMTQPHGALHLASPPLSVADANSSVQPLRPSPGAGGAPDASASAKATSQSQAMALAVTSAPFLESLNVLVSLLENNRAELRGHSSTVARLTRKTCERIGLSTTQTAATVAGAHLHDLGKMGGYHLTALNVSEYEGHRVAALKSVDLPVRLMESVGLLPDTVAVLGAMYERYDGQGIPNGQGAKDIPLGARILAVADTYADLTQNARNPYRAILRPFEACEVLSRFRGTIFDPNIVDLFGQSTKGEDVRARLLSDRRLVLLVDPDPEETTVLELRLIEHGFEIKTARTLAQARQILAENEVTAVVSETDLDTPEAGLSLREAVAKQADGNAITWVFLTTKTDRKRAQRAFDLGVDDFVQKPASADILAAKLSQLIERKAQTSGVGAKGVSGSLAEMALPDIVQILWHGRKTCGLKIQGASTSGQIDFAEGQIVNARWDTLRGEDAFYKMLTLNEGDFRLDPSFKPGARVIQASPETLLLEGMRRLDEGVS
jgi:response regulator RpfG family c-di-GMP phosphodiesterase